MRLEYMKGRCCLIGVGTIVLSIEKAEECFDELSMNGKHLNDIDLYPFVLSLSKESEKLFSFCTRARN